MKWKKLLLIGDSHIQYGNSYKGQAGWVALLADLLQRKCDIISRGFAGYNSRDIAKILPNILGEFDHESICGIIFCIGTNDSATGRTHVSLNDYKNNLNKILKYLTETFNLKREKIIMIVPGKIDDQKWESEEVKLNRISDLFNETVEIYSKECVKFSKESNLLYVDLYEMMDSTGEEYKEFFYDGVHLSAKGSLLLYQNLKVLIEEKIAYGIDQNYPHYASLSIN